MTHIEIVKTEKKFKKSGAASFKIAIANTAAKEAVKLSASEQAAAWLNDRISRATKKTIVEIGWLTPEVAATLLEKNPLNRAPRAKRIDRYARDMREGRWRLNGAPIVISADGLLNDGQLRCASVVKAGTSVETAFVFGVSRESRMTLDQGAVRTTGNYIAMAGLPSCNQVAVVASMIWQYNNLGQMRRKNHSTKTEILLTAMENIEEITTSVRFVGSYRHSRTQVMFCHWLLSRSANPDKADEFIAQLIKGNDLPEKHPILLCKARLEKMTNLAEPQERVELILRSWNTWISGKSKKGVHLVGELPALEGC